MKDFPYQKIKLFIKEKITGQFFCDLSQALPSKGRIQTPKTVVVYESYGVPEVISAITAQNTVPKLNFKNKGLISNSQNVFKKSFTYKTSEMLILN